MQNMKLFLLLAFSSLIMLLEAFRFTDETDMQALMEFKSQVSQAKRVVVFSSWNNSHHVCKWNGVTCGHKHKRVTSLDLGGLQLGGVISPSIGNLSFLISLNLSDNSFGGTIPRDIGNLFRLQILDLSVNHLGGEIPIPLFNCSRLEKLSLYSNPLGGGIPSELGSLAKLVELYLYHNELKGTLPASLGNLTSLMQVSFDDNKLEGKIPDDIGRLTRIDLLQLSNNNFSGNFPPPIYNLSSLVFLDIVSCGFSRELRPDFGILLPNLEQIYLGNNSFGGVIPKTLVNISNLRELRMEKTNMTGSIPPSFGKVPSLQILAFWDNYLGGPSSGDLDFLGALTNCTQLQVLDVGLNRLGGNLPRSIANLSSNLTYLSLQGNFISGSISNDIGNLKNLQALGLQYNLLTGSLPTSLGKIIGLGRLGIHSNRISGEIPSSIGNITLLESLSLFSNTFEGSIPPSLGNCSYMLHLRMEQNRLTGIIPPEIMQISPLLVLSVQNNFLTGSLPKGVGQLKNLVTLSAMHNKLSGELPQALGDCLAMEELYLQGNSFDGVIPDIKGLEGLKRVDLSNNNLSGSIPGYIANFSKLEYFNLSFNNFKGRVPTNGIFRNSTLVMLDGNNDLCGGIKELKLKACIMQAPQKEAKHSSMLKKIFIGICVGIALFLLLFIVSLCWFRKRKNYEANNRASPSTLEVFHEKISYGDLRNATEGFSSSNIVGSGSFGTVFKAMLPTENKVVAVKVLNMQRHGAMKSFMAECESLKEIRHRNLVKLLTACVSIDFQGNQFRALIYEFLTNGSLDMWLHREEVEETRRPSRTLTLLERLNIAIDVASVLDYLHVHCHGPIAHCDLKPSNILLDEDLTAHVSDFGLARLLLKFDQESFFNQLSSAGVRGTIGYTAPEYGTGGKPSIHGDVYSFGVLILEMFTGKRPTNELFEGNCNLHSYTKWALPESVLEIADESILHGGLRVGFPVAECLTIVLNVGLRCCEEAPTNRLATSDAAKELISVRERFFKTRRIARR